MSRLRKLILRAVLVSSIAGAASGLAAIPASAAPSAGTDAPAAVRPLASWIAGQFLAKEDCERVGRDGVRNGVWTHWVCYFTVVGSGPDKWRWVLSVER